MSSFGDPKKFRVVKVHGYRTFINDWAEGKARASQTTSKILGFI